MVYTEFTHKSFNLFIKNGKFHFGDSPLNPGSKWNWDAMLYYPKYYLWFSFSNEGLVLCLNFRIIALKYLRLFCRLEMPIFKLNFSLRISSTSVKAWLRVSTSRKEFSDYISRALRTSDAKWFSKVFSKTKVSCRNHPPRINKPSATCRYFISHASY